MPDSLIYYRKKLLSTANESPIANADGDSLLNDIMLTSDTNNLVLQVTEQQYIELLSSAINGVFQTYPEKPLTVLYPLIKAGKLEFCEQVLGCIENDADVIDAILNLLGSSNAGDLRSIGQSQNDTVFAVGYNPSCDLDILFGQTLQLVEYLHGVNVDILEIIEVVTNRLDMLADVIGDVSGIDESSLDAGVSWIQFIIDSIAENYLAQITQSYLEEIACDLFCRAIDNNCELTPTVLYDCFKDRLSSDVDITELIIETWLYLTSGTWTGQEIADFMFYSQIALRAQLGKVLDKIAFFDVETRLEIYSNDPDPDWAVLCTDCGWEQIFDFTQELFSSYWTASNASFPPVWITDTAMEGGRDSLGCRDGAVFNFNTTATVTFIEAEFAYNNTVANTRDSGFSAGNAGNPLIIDERDTRAGSGTHNYEFNGSEAGIDFITLKFGSRNGASSFSRCTRLTIRGTGTNPFT